MKRFFRNFRYMGQTVRNRGVDKYIDRDDEILVKQADFKLEFGSKNVRRI